MQRIRDRVLRALRKAGKWVDPDAAAEVGDGAGDEPLPGLAASAVKGRAAFGARAGQRDGRWEPPFGIEVLVCPKCSGVRRVLAAIHEPGAIGRVLQAMGLPSAASEQAGSRAPPALAGEGLGDVDEGVAE